MDPEFRAHVERQLRARSAAHLRRHRMRTDDVPAFVGNSGISGISGISGNSGNSLRELRRQQADMYRAQTGAGAPRQAYSVCERCMF